MQTPGRTRWVNGDTGHPTPPEPDRKRKDRDPDDDEAPETPPPDPPPVPVEEPPSSPAKKGPYVV